MSSTLTLPNAKPIGKLISGNNGGRRRPGLHAGYRRKTRYEERSCAVSAHALTCLFLSSIPRSSLVRSRRNWTAEAGSAPFSHDNDDVRSDSTSSARLKVDESTNSSRAPEDGYVGLFINMLGLHNDPLDREQAVSALWRYSEGGKDCVDAIMQFPGCINLIVTLLISDSSSASEAAAGLLRTISSVSIYRELVAESGAVEEIAGLLSRPNITAQVKEQAICTLWNLSINEGTREKIAKSELLLVLIKSLDEEEIKVKEAAGGVLANMSLSGSLHSTLVESGMIPKLAKLLTSDAEGYKIIKKEAKNALMELCKDEYNKILVLEEGLIFVPLVGSEAYKSFRPVTYSWPSLPDGTEIKRTSTPSRFGASELLIGLNIQEKDNIEEAKRKAIVGRSRQQFLARIGAIETEEGTRAQLETPINEPVTLLPLDDGIARLVLILELEDVSAVSRAARAIGDAAISEQIRLSFKEAGAVKQLVQLLKHNDEVVRESVTYALERLSISDEVCRVIQAEDLQPLFSAVKNTATPSSLKEKTVNILAQIFNPGKITKAELVGDRINELISKKNTLVANASQEASNSLSKPQIVIWEYNLVDLEAIPCLVELLKTSSPNMQRTVASILEYITSFDVLPSEILSSDIISALVAVLEQRCPHGEESKGDEESTTASQKQKETEKAKEKVGVNRLYHMCSLKSYNNTSKSMVYTKEQLMMLSSTAFANLVNMPNLAVDIGLLEDLIDRYVDEDIFLLADGEERRMTVDDVGIILGIPSKGIEITQRKDFAIVKSIWQEFANATCKNRNEGETSKKLREKDVLHKDNLTKLWQEYAKTNNPTDNTNMCRAWMLHLLATFLIPDTSYCAPIYIIHYLDDVTATGQMNWAKLVHGSIFKNMKMLKENVQLRRKGDKGAKNTLYTTGCVMCLCVWAYEMTKMAKPTFLDSKPRIKKWAAPVEKLMELVKVDPKDW